MSQAERVWSDAEAALLQRYLHMGTSTRSYLHRLVVELLPPVAFVALWWWTGNAVFLLALIAVQVVFNVARVVVQQKARVQLHGIATKVLAEQPASDIDSEEMIKHG